MNVIQRARGYGAEGKGADDYAGQQVAQNRRHVDAPEQHQGDSGHRHGDGKILNQPDAFIGAGQGEEKKNVYFRIIQWRLMFFDYTRTV